MVSSGQEMSVNMIDKFQHGMEMCNASYAEILLHYLINPGVFLYHVYESITTMRWKFFFK